MLLKEPGDAGHRWLALYTIGKNSVRCYTYMYTVYIDYISKSHTTKSIFSYDGEKLQNTLQEE
jgi:hypothetical protein